MILSPLKVWLQSYHQKLGLLSVKLFIVHILCHMLFRSTITLSHVYLDIASSGVCSIHHHFQNKDKPLFKGWSQTAQQITTYLHLPSIVCQPSKSYSTFKHNNILLNQLTEYCLQFSSSKDLVKSLFSVLPSLYLIYLFWKNNTINPFWPPSFHYPFSLFSILDFLAMLFTSLNHKQPLTQIFFPRNGNGLYLSSQI